jgi:hypothetical protein
LIAQESLQLTAPQRLTNNEVLLRLNAPAGRHYRIDASIQLPVWQPLFTLMGTGSNQHTDSAAPFYPVRFYRGADLNGIRTTTGIRTVQ